MLILSSTSPCLEGEEVKFYLRRGPNLDSWKIRSMLILLINLTDTWSTPWSESERLGLQPRWEHDWWRRRGEGAPVFQLNGRSTSIGEGQGLGGRAWKDKGRLLKTVNLKADPRLGKRFVCAALKLIFDSLKFSSISSEGARFLQQQRDAIAHWGILRVKAFLNSAKIENASSLSFSYTWREGVISHWI